MLIGCTSQRKFDKGSFPSHNVEKKSRLGL